MFFSTTAATLSRIPKKSNLTFDCHYYQTGKSGRRSKTFFASHAPWAVSPLFYLDPILTHTHAARTFNRTYAAHVYLPCARLAPLHFARAPIALSTQTVRVNICIYGGERRKRPVDGMRHTMPNLEEKLHLLARSIDKKCLRTQPTSSPSPGWPCPRPAIATRGNTSPSRRSSGRSTGRATTSTSS